LIETVEYIIGEDSAGNNLKGDKTYRLKHPVSIPASDFWSVIVYDSLTRLIIKTDQSWPSVHSNCKHLIVNADGSVDIWFGPDPPAGNETNWIKTIPSKEWYAVMRIYNLNESDSSGWKPGEILVIQ
jgi:hypothetical protein